MPEQFLTASNIDWDDRPFAIVDSRIITRAEFLAQAFQLSTELPNKSFAINLCKNKYKFALAFMAVLLKKQTNILPPNTAKDTISELLNNYTDSYIVEDTLVDRDCFSILIEKETIFPSQVLIEAEHLAAIIFTSGSTGKAQPNNKYWWQLIALTQQKAEHFSFSKECINAIIATVPPQHMFGLEMSVLLPIFAWGLVVSEETFYPDDLRRTMNAMSFPIVLISTPVHLGACFRAGLDWRPVEKVISATAPLGKELADSIEDIFSCPVLEIFGSTETGAIASKRTSVEIYWHLFDQVEVKTRIDGAVEVKSLKQMPWVEVADQINMIDDHRFELIGRHSDMVKIAGKRASLSDLSIKLTSLDGVIDGVVIDPHNQDSNVGRLAAFVVAPDHSVKEINKMFLNKTDPVFIPRPLIKVDKLPRNATGKLTKASIKTLYNKYIKND